MGVALLCWDGFVGGLLVAAALETASRPGGTPAKITNPAWSHSNSRSALTMTSAEVKRCRRAVYRIGAVEVSLEGGFRQRSVFGGAPKSNEPIHCGTDSRGVFRALNEDLSGGIALR